ncbi:GNAT family N-acetyltransferase [Anaerolentibacter hominis]|uniref:GNAT family N-acetyltransferase n=1 Tax=Anaerolentibacter hominis TaxID=3079009 RepID=UPI0031B8741A
MALEFIPVQGEASLHHLAEIANEVWHEFFVSILTPEQIDYMVEKFQSYPAMTDQVEHQGYEYFFMRLDGTDIGYTGIRSDGDEGKLFLSKLYLKKEYRGRGFASQAFAFLEGLCLARGLNAIWLTVNRYNDHTIAVYKKKGFEVMRTQVADIGNGFVMDDYIMEKKLRA